mgnify:FL=1
MDPLAQKYSNWSGYHYVGGNPLINIDPDGREIRIQIEGNLTDGDGNEIRDKNGNVIKATGWLVYEIGMETTGKHDYADQVITALNHLHNTGADVEGVIPYLANSDEFSLPIFAWRPVPGIPSNQKDYFNTNNEGQGGAFVMFDPNYAMTFHESTPEPGFIQYWFGTWGTRSPAEALLHELGHAASYFQNPSLHEIDSTTPVAAYHNFEEMDVIRSIENPANEILQGDESIERVHHGGFMYLSKGVLSTEKK